MTQQQTTEHVAKARITNLPISTKHSVEISRHLRYKKTSFAKQFLAKVVAQETPVPFRKFYRDVGHKKGNVAAGRFPQKAAQEFIRLVKSVEANAQDKGLDTANLKITKILANKASVPFMGGRRRRGTKRTHLEIEVKEGAKKEKKVAKKAPKADAKKQDTKKAEPAQKQDAPKADVKKDIPTPKEPVAKVEEVKKEAEAEAPQQEETPAAPETPATEKEAESKPEVEAKSEPVQESETKQEESQ